MSKGWYKDDGYDLEDKPYIYVEPPKDKINLTDVNLAKKYAAGFKRYGPPTEISVLDAVCTAVQYASLFTKGLTPQPSRRFVYYNARALPLMDVYKSSTKWPNEVHNVSLKIRQALRAVTLYGVSKEELFPWVVQDFSHAESAVWGVNERPGIDSYKDAATGPVFEPYRLDSYQPEAMDGMDEFELRALGTSTLTRIRLCLAEEYPVIFAFHLFWETFKTVGPAQSGDEGYPTIEKIPAERRFVGPRVDKNYDVQVGLIVGLDHRKRRVLVKSAMKDVEYFWMPYEWIIDVHATKSFWMIRNAGKTLSPPTMERVDTSTWCQKWDTLSPWKIEEIDNSASVSMAPNSSISVISRNEGVLDMFWISEQCTIERVYHNLPKHEWKRQTIELEDPRMKPYPGAIASVSADLQKLDLFWMTASGAICNASTYVTIDREPAVWEKRTVFGDGTAEPRGGLAATIGPRNTDKAGKINLYCVGPDGCIKYMQTTRSWEGPDSAITIADVGSAYDYSNLSAVADYIRSDQDTLYWTDVIVWVTPRGTIGGKRQNWASQWVDIWEVEGETDVAWLDSRISAILHDDEGYFSVYYVTEDEQIFVDTAVITVEHNQSYDEHDEKEAFGEKATKVRLNSGIEAVKIGPGEKPMVLWQNEHGQLMMGGDGEYAVQLSTNRGVRQGSPLGVGVLYGKPVIAMKIDDGVIGAGYWGDISK
ncbi:hypothetical protein ACKLNR_013981 [Fusarium oxysporum f. sp. zingiberi]